MRKPWRCYSENLGLPITAASALATAVPVRAGSPYLMMTPSMSSATRSRCSEESCFLGRSNSSQHARRRSKLERVGRRSHCRDLPQEKVSSRRKTEHLLPLSKRLAVQQPPGLSASAAGGLSLIGALPAAAATAGRCGRTGSCRSALLHGGSFARPRSGPARPLGLCWPTSMLRRRLTRPPASTSASGFGIASVPPPRQTRSQLPCSS
mmetsp:Transcript_10317/g.23207  ORF Transcript_10317/g.23207 Transcript_10317/m.23207 type:complete len:208 (-) Transcript_10317:518-1141(-)